MTAPPFPPLVVVVVLLLLLLLLTAAASGFSEGEGIKGLWISSWPIPTTLVQAGPEDWLSLTCHHHLHRSQERI